MDYGEYAESLAKAEFSLGESEIAEAKFRARKKYVEREVADEDRRFNRPISAVATKVAVDTRLGQDALAKTALGDNRWHIARATMYATMAIAKQNEIIIAQNGQIINALKELKNG